jgi:hypothetical protein
VSQWPDFGPTWIPRYSSSKEVEVDVCPGTMSAAFGSAKIGRSGAVLRETFGGISGGRPPSRLMAGQTTATAARSGDQGPSLFP